MPKRDRPSNSDTFPKHLPVREQRRRPRTSADRPPPTPTPKRRREFHPQRRSPAGDPRSHAPHNVKNRGAAGSRQQHAEGFSSRLRTPKREEALGQSIAMRSTSSGTSSPAPRPANRRTQRERCGFRGRPRASPDARAPLRRNLPGETKENSRFWSLRLKRIAKRPKPHTRTLCPPPETHWRPARPRSQQRRLHSTLESDTKRPGRAITPVTGF